MALGSAAAVATSLVLLVLTARGVLGFDQFWIYPITCVVFALVVFSMSVMFRGAPRPGEAIRSQRDASPRENSSTADSRRGVRVAGAKGSGA
jgi:hypothetical protein